MLIDGRMRYLEDISKSYLYYLPKLHPVCFDSPIKSNKLGSQICVPLGTKSFSFLASSFTIFQQNFLLQNRLWFGLFRLFRPATYCGYVLRLLWQTGFLIFQNGLHGFPFLCFFSLKTQFCGFIFFRLFPAPSTSVNNRNTKDMTE